jgi:ATP-dependent DNA ligase
LSLFNLKNSEIRKLHQGKGFDMFVGEYMNKSKKDEKGRVFNHKFVIFDVIVSKGKHLTNSTYEERLDVLYDMFYLEDYNDYLYQISDNIFLIKTFDRNFEMLYNKMIKVDMLEGLVLKRKNGKLERGTRQKNNMGWMLKVRHPCNNYTF